MGAEHESVYTVKRYPGNPGILCDSKYLSDADVSVSAWSAGRGCADSSRDYFPAGTAKGSGTARRKTPLASITLPGSSEKEERFSDKTVNELVRASFEMGKVKTGALIVIERNITLEEFEKTGIEVDGILSSQLLINIFEHNTPLHDGAVIVRGDRIVSATCYLPLSDNMTLSKDLGTRHRAGVGVSEATDSFTIIVSEETGNVSYAMGGELTKG